MNKSQLRQILYRDLYADRPELTKKAIDNCFISPHDVLLRMPIWVTTYWAVYRPFESDSSELPGTIGGKCFSTLLRQDEP